MQKALAIGVATALLACATPTAGPREAQPPTKPVVRTSGDDYRVPKRVGEFELESLSDYADEPLVVDLAELHGAGFARELIWLTAQPPHAAAPADLRLDDFKAFHRDRLSGRALLRRVPVTVQFGDDTTASGSEPTSAAGAAPAP